jgi:hypothetical protein
MNHRGSTNATNSEIQEGNLPSNKGAPVWTIPGVKQQNQSSLTFSPVSLCVDMKMDSSTS